MNLVTGGALFPYLPQMADLIRTQLPEVRNIESHHAIAVVSGGEVLAVVLYGDYDPPNMQMHVASKHPRWCSRAVLRGLFSYPFCELRLRRVTALIAKRNRHARNFVGRLGFIHEGTHRQGMLDGGVLCSYGMTRDDCKWIS